MCPQEVGDAELLELMIAAAIDAGRAAYEIYGGDFTVQRKADHSPVTSADQAAEAIILEQLRRAAPQIPVIAEEEVAAGRVPQVGRQFFLVDPLDGTKEFIQKRGDFTVNIALIRDRSPALGVVYAPAKSSLFGGNVNTHSAFRSDQSPAIGQGGPPAARRPIGVRPAPPAGLTVVSSRSHSTPETEAYLAPLPVADRVSIGSSLKFCLVASAQADLYPRLGPTMEWDTAAGHAVLLAAGGSVWAPGGVPLLYGKPGYRNSFFVASGTWVPPPLAA